jgi:YidC/Oxa1 family membrane protein insertase
MEERRLLLAIALSLVVLTAWRYLTPTPPPPEVGPKPAVPGSVASGPEAMPPPGTVPPASPAPTVVAPLADERERRIEVVGPDATIAFTNKGARLISWRLEAFKDAKGRDEEMVANVPGGPRPLDVETGDPSVDARLLEGLFKASAETLPLTSAGGTLTFRYAQGDLEAEKLLRFEPKGYLASLSVQVRQAGKNLPVRLLWGPGLGNPTPQEKEVQGYVPPQAVALARGGVERIPAEKLSTPQALPEVEWVGVESQYFAALLVPPGRTGAGELRAVSVAEPGGEAQPAPLVALDLPSGDAPALLYVGPKDHTQLSRLGHGLVAVVPVGDWIGPIVVPLMKLLRFVHGHIGNYGWSIVLLTVLINLAMAPLRHRPWTRAGRRCSAKWRSCTPATA